ncbi:MAG: hypothetical protein EA377_00585 [Phycisphaerales bacterium]|nr:MAG: hypothetical protein EA377_00585 [Phycisphaerales bacterium]
MRKLIGVGTPRGLQGLNRAVFAAIHAVVRRVTRNIVLLRGVMVHWRDRIGLRPTDHHHHLAA